MNMPNPNHAYAVHVTWNIVLAREKQTLSCWPIGIIKMPVTYVVRNGHAYLTTRAGLFFLDDSYWYKSDNNELTQTIASVSSQLIEKYFNKTQKGFPN